MESQNEGQSATLEQLRTRFAGLEDPRVERTKLHSLLDIITIAITIPICAVICGADDWSEIELFGHAKEVFFKSFLALPNGIPTAYPPMIPSTECSRVFARLNPEQFQKCCLEWVQELRS